MTPLTDNVLVSLKKWEELIAAVEYMSTCVQLRGSNQGQYKAILAMPHVIESARDVYKVVDSIFLSLPFTTRSLNDNSTGATCREAFEAQYDGYSMKRNPSGNYTNEETNMLWNCWWCAWEKATIATIPAAINALAYRKNERDVSYFKKHLTKAEEMEFSAYCKAREAINALAYKGGE